MRLYKSTETEFNHNGIGFLQPVSCFVTEERNGEFELEMRYALDGLNYSDIKNQRIILAKPNPTDREQPFRIYKITKPMGGIINVYARHISYDLSGIPLSPFSASNISDALYKITAYSAVENPFEFWTDKTTDAYFNVGEPLSVRAIMGGRQGSLLDVYGGEYAYDRYTVRLYNNRGNNNGVTIRYGKNLTDLRQEENIEAVYTGVYPYWKKEDEYIELPEKIVLAEGNFSFTRILTLDLSVEWEEQPTLEQLRNKSLSYMESNNIGVPKVSIKVSFLPLEQTEEYKNTALFERVNLCDTVTVLFDKLGVNATAKCVKVIYDVLKNKYDSLELGESRTNITDRILNQQEEIESKVSFTAMEQAVAHSTEWLTNGKGFKVERRDAAGNTIDTLYMDTPDINTAVNVLRVGQSGIGFSHSGVNGPYVSAWTIDGRFNADFIVAGTINAALVKIKNLIADHVKSEYSGLYLMELWAAMLTLKENNKLRARLYTVNYKNSDDYAGMLQVFEGNVDEDGILNEGGSYSSITPRVLKVGEQPDGTFAGTIESGKIRTKIIEANTVNADIVTADSVNSQNLKADQFNTSKYRIGIATDNGFKIFNEKLWISDHVKFTEWSDGSAGITSADRNVTIRGNESRIQSTAGSYFTVSPSRFTFGNSGSLLVDCYNNLDMHNFSVLNQSDARLKTEIKPTKIKALDIINQIDLQQFKWIDSGKKEEIGVIAQQLQSLAPDLVHENPLDRHLSIKSDKLIYYCIKAIQELSGKTKSNEINDFLQDKIPN